MSLSFKQYLEEKVITPWKIDKLDVEGAIALLNKHCKNGIAAIQKDKLLYRGFSGSITAPFAIIDSTKSERTSKDFSNLYQLSMDASEHLKHFPSRSEALICTPEYYAAKAYSGKGQTYVVFPFDGTSIVGGPEGDFMSSRYDGPLNSYDNMSSLDSSLRDFVSSFWRWSKTYTSADIPKIDAKIKSINPYQLLLSLADIFEQDEKKFFKMSAQETEEREEIIWGSSKKIRIDYRRIVLNAIENDDKNITLTPLGKEFLQAFKSDSPFAAFSSILLKPKYLTLSQGIFSKQKFSGETWFTGQAIVIRQDIFVGILDTMREQKIITRNPRSFHGAK